MRYIISTSGRESSIKRYQKLLKEVLKLDISYIPFESTKGGPIEPQEFIGKIKSLGAIGGAISKDIKNKIIPYLDEIDEFAKQVQSVNTVIKNKDKLIGYNTDAYGFELAIKNGIKKSGLEVKNAVVYGYGGVFNVAYHVLNSLGIEVSVTGRRQGAVDKINKKFNLKPYDCNPKDLFVNATPISDKPLEEAEGFLDAIKGSKIVFDHQMPGKYVEEYCRNHNILHIPGTEMYYPQMYKQWALFLKGNINEKDLPELIAKAERLAKLDK